MGTQTVPGPAMLEHGIENNLQFAHASRESQLLRLTSNQHLSVEALGEGVLHRRGDRGQAPRRVARHAGIALRWGTCLSFRQIDSSTARDKLARKEIPAINDGWGYRMSAKRIAVVAVVALLMSAGVVAGVAYMVLMGHDDGQYTKSLVEKAIRRYDRDGRQAAIEYYSSGESVNGQWYVFIVDGNGYTIAHPNPEFVGRDPSLRVDATGYFYGDDLLAATEEGRWVDYVLRNPVTGQDQQKHTWVVKRDGLLFASGWYEN